MTRRSNKKPLYNSTFKRISTKESIAVSADGNGVSTFILDVRISLYTNLLLKTGVLCLLVSFILQPIFVQAQEMGVEEPAVVVATAGEDPEPFDEEIEVEISDLAEEVKMVDEAKEVVIVEPPTQVDVVDDEIRLSALETRELEPGDLGETENLSGVEAQEFVIPFSEATSTNGSIGLNDTETVSATTTDFETHDSVTSVLTATSTDIDGSGGVSSSQEDADDFLSSESTTTEEQAAASNASIGIIENEEDEFTEPAEDINEGDGFENATTTDQNNASSTEIANSNMVTIFNSAAEYAFKKDECTLVEDGSYYCQKSNSAPVKRDDLYAELDKDGDLEIFLRRNGEVSQITQNLADDASPYFDPRSNTIVWHRLLNDRYQIVSYDLSDGEENILTNTRVNNMEPSRSGDLIVWQRWVDDNWEIILYSDGTETQLTDSVEHDIAPDVRGDLVIWSVRSSDGTHSLRTYDVSSGIFNDIKDPEGVAVANPRMVVMYDAVYSNGDTVMKGFDLVTGELIPLNQTPAELPDELPEPDSTGETRALVAPSPAKPEQDDSESDLDSDPESEPEPVPEDTTQTESTLDLSAATTSTPVSLLENTDTAFYLDLKATSTVDVSVIQEIPDLVIPADATATTSSQT